MEKPRLMLKILALPNFGRSYQAVRPEAECYISFAKAGHDVTIMLNEDNAYLDEYLNSDVNVVMLKTPRKYSWAVIRQIHRFIKSHQIDIVYATDSGGIPNAAFGCIGTNAKMIAYRGTTRGMYRRDITNYLCTLHPRIDGYVCLSIAVKDNVEKKVRRAIRPNLEIIYKGHDIAWYRDSPIILENIGASSQKFNLLFLGSNRPSKGQEYMLDAMVHLKDLEDINLIMIGDGFDGEPYQSQIKNTGVADRIIQPGFRSDVPQIAAACDISVLTSLEEGLSRFLLESLANGTPVITSDCGGPTEFIEDDVNGFIVPIKDGKAVADKVRLLYGDRETLQRLAGNARKTIETNMSHATTVEHMLQYFEKMKSG
jgi:glycosyltransferase involved in cell wall biosynthesis